MKKLAIYLIDGSLLIVCIIGLFLKQFSVKPIPLNIPSNITSVVLKNNEGEEVKLADTTDIVGFEEFVDHYCKLTNQKSLLQDYLPKYHEYIYVSMNYTEEKVNKLTEFYIYELYDEYFLEQPKGGKFILTEEEYQKFKDYYSNLKEKVIK